MNHLLLQLLGSMGLPAFQWVLRRFLADRRGPRMAMQGVQIYLLLCLAGSSIYGQIEWLILTPVFVRVMGSANIELPEQALQPHVIRSLDRSRIVSGNTYTWSLFNNATRELDV